MTTNFLNDYHIINNLSEVFDFRNMEQKLLKNMENVFLQLRSNG